MNNKIKTLGLALGLVAGTLCMTQTAKADWFYSESSTTTEPGMVLERTAPVFVEPQTTKVIERTTPVYEAPATQIIERSSPVIIEKKRSHGLLNLHLL